MKRRKRTLLAIALALITGCLGSEFKDESEELEYLSSISQPIVAQFRRKKELEQKAMQAALRAEAARRISVEEDRKIAEARRRAEEKAMEPILKAQREAEAKAALEEAEKWEKIFYPGTARADIKYRDLLSRYPGTPEAAVAERRIAEIKEAVKRREEEEAGKR